MFWNRSKPEKQRKLMLTVYYTGEKGDLNTIKMETDYYPEEASKFAHYPRFIKWFYSRKQSEWFTFILSGYNYLTVPRAGIRCWRIEEIKD